ncbi:MAG: RES domain-containing protein [Paracoccaceae bacterium]|nr:MAG: RES domain-containing protein [Paracoccaceae bacterium]
MTAQRLDRTLAACRIGDAQGRFPIFDPGGAALVAGRWHDTDHPVIYASEHFATAMLEILAHSGGVMPPRQHWIAITLPYGLSYEVFPEATHPDWAAPDCATARAYGCTWRAEGRSAILLVPSIVARVERNILINPDHPEFRRIETGLHQPVAWDSRLFRG